MKTEHGKIVEIHRYFNLVEMQQDDPEVKAWLGQSYRGIGPYYKNKITATGLSFEEQKFLLPEVLGIEYTDKDFRRAVNRFYDEFVTSIPKDGLKLQIGLEDDTKELSPTNMPLNIMDYLRYRHIMDHPIVGKNKTEAERYSTKRYYILDPKEMSQKAIDINTLEDKATVLYMQFKDDLIKVDQILTMLGVNVTNMTQEAKILKLKSFAQKNNKLGVAQQREAFDRFIKTVTDKDLEYKYLIEEMIGAQYLKRVGNSIHYFESGVVIADNLEDAVAYFKNPKNSREANLLKAEYLTKIKRGEKYLPNDNPEPEKLAKTAKSKDVDKTE